MRWFYYSLMMVLVVLSGCSSKFEYEFQSHNSIKGETSIGFFGNDEVQKSNYDKSVEDLTSKIESMRDDIMAVKTIAKDAKKTATRASVGIDRLNKRVNYCSNESKHTPVYVTISNGSIVQYRNVADQIELDRRVQNVEQQSRHVLELSQMVRQIAER